MVARKYNTYKFTYSSDLGTDTIKTQREYLDENNESITPITPLFLVRVIQSPIKVEPKKNSDLRHAISFISTGTNTFGEFKSYIPYSDVTNKSEHLRQIDALDRVLCIKYVGEVIDYAK